MIRLFILSRMDAEIITDELIRGRGRQIGIIGKVA